MTSTIRIIGVDPGLRATGWGVVDHAGARLSAAACGVIAPRAEASMAVRLAALHDGLTDLLVRHRPAAVAIENVHVALNPVAALALGQARGALLAAAGRAGLPTFEYPPNTVKKAVCGAGKAPKSQVAFMVRRLLPTAQPPSQDAIDALALAVCAALRGDVRAASLAGAA